jgi:hypothetical protein
VLLGGSSYVLDSVNLREARESPSGGMKTSSSEKRLSGLPSRLYLEILETDELVRKWCDVERSQFGSGCPLGLRKSGREYSESTRTRSTYEASAAERPTPAWVRMI